MYNTKQQAAIIDFFAAHQDSYLTVQEISDYMGKQNIKIGLTTIYRHLERLIEKGIINKIKVEGMSSACFKYNSFAEEKQETSKAYFGLKCEKCGTITKIDCSHLRGFYEHIGSEHQFMINPNKTVFYGICRSCMKKFA